MPGARPPRKFVLPRPALQVHYPIVCIRLCLSLLSSPCGPDLIPTRQPGQAFPQVGSASSGAPKMLVQATLEPATSSDPRLAVTLTM